MKFSHYLRLHTKEQNDTEYDYRLDICNFPYRYGTHWDVGIVTLERMDHSMQGFQIFVNNQWYNIDANDYDNSNSILVINGKQMEYWTNGYWKASIHRVLSGYKPRIALLFFTQPSSNITIQPIENCKVCQRNNSEYKHIYGKTINQLLQEL